MREMTTTPEVPIVVPKHIGRRTRRKAGLNEFLIIFSVGFLVTVFFTYVERSR
jgi:hypothetical protein